MTLRARRNGLLFDRVAFDGGYGQLPWLLQSLDVEGERFLAEMHADQRIGLSDPLRDGKKGEVVAEFLTARVFVRHDPMRNLTPAFPATPP